MPNLGPGELFIIFLIILVLFGAGRLAGLGAAVGKSIRDLRQALQDDRPEPPGSPEP
ncbi:MAG TPA: twin-arginine translocase TatA/TatE family subunit [Herpetosiphonaceae bacterium]|nr:twin-arginine translocase TatA/TatE family subunit [Herpetosiphonaceae bacterium]